jgi:hypothetical protein
MRSVLSRCFPVYRFVTDVSSLQCQGSLDDGVFPPVRVADLTWWLGAHLDSTLFTPRRLERPENAPWWDSAGCFLFHFPDLL